MSLAVETTAAFPGAIPTLKGRTVYFAHPIDFRSLRHDAMSRMHQIRKRMLDEGAVVYDPAGAFDVPSGGRPTAIVSRVNRAALLAADLLVACYPESPGVGTAMEIQLADDLGMPALILTDVADRSWSLAGLEHARLVKGLHSEDVSWLAEEAAEYAAVRGRGPAPDPLPLWVAADHPDYTPVRKHATDAGFDLFVSKTTEIPPGSIVDIPAGCAVQFPENVWGMVVGRSSTSRTHNLLVHPGIIDTGYRGPLFVQVQNLNGEPFKAEEGMRLGQLLPLPNLAAQMTAVQTVALEPSDRGPAGFGSTGV